MKAYITKFWLTKGIFETDVAPSGVTGKSYKKVGMGAIFNGKDVYFTEDEAKKAILLEIGRKRESLHKQIKKLEDLEIKYGDTSK
jgi:hypothetical protein